MSRTTVRAAVACVVAALTLAFAAPAQAESVVPPEGRPAGANDWSCQPSEQHPRPVVLVHGLSANAENNWSYISPALAADGYCVFTLTYGLDPRTRVLPYRPGGVLPMEQSAQELALFIDRVLATTGATQVDLVGHSEGTVMPRYYLERLGGAPNVERFVALTPLWRGTQVGGAAFLRELAPLGLSPLFVNLFSSVCGSCPQFLTGSSYLNDLNDDGEAIPGVEHTNIVTRYDELVIPYTSGLMRDGGTNIVLQDVCPLNLSEHVLVAFDPAVLQLIRNALDPANATAVSC